MPSNMHAQNYVEVVAPGSKAPWPEFENGLTQLENWGLVPNFSPKLFSPPTGVYGKMHAQSDLNRWLNLKAALYSKNSQIIWCARGGYGSLKLLPWLLKEEPKLKKLQPKLLIGLSDISILHYFFNVRLKWPTLHAPVLTRLGSGLLPTKDLMELKKLLLNSKFTLVHKLKVKNKYKPNTQSQATNRRLVINAPVLGGNLTSLATLMGNPAFIGFPPCILFLEDVSERAYRLDRYFEQLLQAGALKNVKAIVLGDFTDCNEPDGKNLTPSLFQAWSDRINIPICYGLKSGHGRSQRPLPFLKPAKLSITVKKAQLIF